MKTFTLVTLYSSLVMAEYAGSYSSPTVKKCRAHNVPTVTVIPTTTAIPTTIAISTTTKTTTTVAPVATQAQFAPKQATKPKAQPQTASFAPKQKPATIAKAPTAPLAKVNTSPQQPKPAPPPKPNTSNGGDITVAGIKIPAAIVKDAKLCLSEVINIIPLPKTGSFNGDCLSLHNSYRSVLGLGPYTFDAHLQSVAQGVVNDLAARDAFEHSHLGFGENLHQQSGGGQLSCGDAVKAWFAEFKFYNGVPIGSANFEQYGHFTQVISPQSTSFGCAVAPYTAPDGTFKQTVACEYSPAGNVVGTVLDRQYFTIIPQAEDLLNNGQKTVNHEMLAVGERVKAITKEAEKALKAAKNTLDQLYTIPKQVQELLFSAKNEGLVHFHDWRQAALYIHQVQKAQDCPP